MSKSFHFFFACARFFIALGILGYLSLSGAIDWAAMSKLANQGRLAAAALLAVAMALIVQAQRLCLLFRPHGLHLSIYPSVKLTLIGTFFNSCLPGATGGDAIKIYYALEGNPGRGTEIATVILFDRIIGIFALCLLTVLMVALAPTFFSTIPELRMVFLGSAFLSVAMLVGLCMLFVSSLAGNAALAGLIGILPFSHHIRRVYECIRSYRECKGLLAHSLWLSLIGHLLNIAAIMIIAEEINPAGASWKAAVLTPIGFIATQVPLTPGGVGVGEAGLDWVFALAGLAGGAELLLTWRILTIIMGLFGLVFYLQGKKHYLEKRSIGSEHGG